MKVYTKDIKTQAKRSLAWVLETDSILIKGKRERFLKHRCLKRFDGMKLNRRKYISISEVISLLYTLISARAKTHTKFNVHHRYRALRAKRMLTDSRVHAHSHKRACTHIHTSAVFAHVHCCALTHNIQA